MNEQLYLIRSVDQDKGRHFYYSGSGMYAVPKLYKIGDAKRVVRKENQFRAALNNNLYNAQPKCSMVEAIPVTFQLGDPTQFKE